MIHFTLHLCPIYDSNMHVAHGPEWDSILHSTLVQSKQFVIPSPKLLSVYSQYISAYSLGKR